MAFDGLVTYAICKELNSNIIGSRIEKIHMPTKNEIIFITHSNNEKLKLLISIDPSNARVHFTWGQKENPTKAPSFCMVLRKYLQGSKILSINQNGLDRVIIINFENINELGDKVTYNLYIELMGKYSNIILVNEKNKILDSIKHVDFTMSSVREVLPARDYIIPTNLGKISFLELSEDEFCKIILDIKNNEFYSYETMSKIISNTFVGFSKTFIDTIISKLDLKENLTYDQAKNIYKEILLILSNISNNNISLKLYENDYHFDLNFINNEFLDTKDQISNNIEKKYHNSIFLDGFYLKKELDNSIKTAKFNLLKDVNSFKNKYLKNLSRVNDIISEKENMSKYKLYGELIQANIYRISPGINKISVENYYDNNNLIEIPLNTSISPAMNSGAYFKKYTKIKNAISMAEKQKEDYINNINYLDNVSYLIDSSSSIEEIEAIKQELTLAGYKNYWSIKRNSISANFSQ